MTPKFASNQAIQTDAFIFFLLLIHGIVDFFASFYVQRMVAKKRKWGRRVFPRIRKGVCSNQPRFSTHHKNAVCCTIPEPKRRAWDMECAEIDKLQKEIHKKCLRRQKREFAN